MTGLLNFCQLNIGLGMKQEKLIWIISLLPIHDAISEVSEPYGDTWEHPVLEQKSKEWHIGRIIYFINHPKEIRDIEIDNECNNGFILPQPIIVDGG